MTRRPTVLVAGYSARALGRSALTAGLDVIVVDGFGDRDLVEPEPRPARHVLAQPFHPRHVARLGAAIPSDAFAYGSNFENHPVSVAALARDRALWGNTPTVLRAVRRPERFTAALRATGRPAPRLAHEHPDPARSEWLVKPRRGGGGRGIRAWNPGEPVRRHEYRQERIDGIPGSLVFLAGGRTAVPLALTRQLSGDTRFGAWGHCYVGSMLASRRHSLFEAQDAVFESALQAAEVLTAGFGLVGLNTVDFVARDGVAWPVEVNPRHSASMELIERELCTSLFPAHVDAVHGELSRRSHDPLGWNAVAGKAILYASRRMTMSGSDALLAAADVADISADGTALAAGAPVCTVFARAATQDACVAELAGRSTVILARLARPREAA
jgi:predicted ATP-grasp superfamily ATP-dependent carboligase